MMKYFVRLFVAIMLLMVWHAAGMAQCTGAGGIPFNCKLGGAIGAGDLFLGGQSGNTVKFTGAQISTFVSTNLLGSPNSWGAPQTFLQSNSSAASINIPPGAAPSAPANGDVWETAAGLFLQVNGTTIGPVGAGSASLGANTFTGTQTMPASTSILTPLVIPPGTAPTSPVNGSMWTTSAGLYVQIAGSPVGPLGTGGGGGGSISLFDLQGNSVLNVTNLTFGANQLLSGTSPNATISINSPTRIVTACSGIACTMTANDVGGQVDFDGTNLTLTIPNITSVSVTGSMSGTTLTVSSGTGIEIGDAVTGAGVPAATIITGGSGTSWTTNNSATFGSEPLTISMLASGQTFVVVNGNTTPVTISSTATILPAGTTQIQPKGGIGCDSTGSVLYCVLFGPQPNQAFLNQDNTYIGFQTWAASNRAPNSIASGTSAYQLQLSDCGGIVQTNSAGAFTLTLLNTLPVGCTTLVEQDGAGQVTVISDGASTLQSAHSYTKTFNAAGAQIWLRVHANSGGAAAAYTLSGDGAP